MTSARPQSHGGARASGRDDAAEIKRRLVANIERVAQTLAPGGRRDGPWYMALNPTRADRSIGSFWVRLAGDRAGSWADEATGDGAAQGRNGTHAGDVFGLIQYCLACDFAEAIAWARDFLGLEKYQGRPLPRLAPPPILNQAEQEAEARGEAERKAAAVVRTFKAAKIRKFSDSPADLYLLGRAIDVRVLGKQPGVLGWLPDCLHTETGTRWPAMIAAFQRPDYTVCALHKTFLGPCGPLYDKAPVEPDRKMWPSCDGAVIRLWRGASGWREDRCAAAGLLETLVLTEGIEDGLSMAMAGPAHRIWAVGSLGNLGKITLPDCAERVIVCQDNDWGKPQAAVQFRNALAALARQTGPAGQREILVTRSPVGKDANDALRGRRA